MLVGGLEHGFYDFPIILEMENHPNWLSLHFFRGVGSPPQKKKRPGFAVNVDDQLGQLQASGGPPHSDILESIHSAMGSLESIYWLVREASMADWKSRLTVGFMVVF